MSRSTVLSGAALRRKPARSVHGSPAATGRRAAAAASTTAPGGSAGGIRSPAWRSMNPVSTRAATKSGWLAARARKPALVLSGKDLHAARRLGEPSRRVRARCAVHDELGDHRIVEGRNRAALLDAAVDPRALGKAQAVERPDRGQEAGRRILGIEPRLHGPAADRQLVLRQRQRLAARHAQLPFHEVLAGDRLRHGVLDLQPRVHLHEPDAVGAEALRPVGDELDRAGPDIVHGFGRPHRRLADGAPRRLVHAGAGASSITFWCRRWSEQSRSKRWTTLPWVSPKTCTSIWRGAVM